MAFDAKEFISPVIRELPPSGIRRFFGLAAEMKDVISLGIGEPDFVTPEKIRNAGIASLQAGKTGYTSNAGLLELREAIAEYLATRFDVHYDPKDEIMITVGGSEAIDLALRAIINPGDEVLLPEPCYVSYRPSIIMARGVPVTVETSDVNGFKITPEMLEEKITPKTKALLINYPGNPCGGIMTKEDFEAIVPVIIKHNLLVITDEIYAELTYEGKHTSIASLPGMKERTILISGMSKAFAMTGWRIGYVCAHPDIYEQIYKIHQYVIMSAPTMGQYAALEAFRNGLDDMRYMVGEYKKRRDLITKGLRDAGLSLFLPMGAFYAFPSIKVTGLSSEDFCMRLLNEKRVAVVPGYPFGDCGEGFVRCSYAYSVEHIQEACSRIAEFVEEVTANR